MKYHRQQDGLTLIEMMIAILIGLIIMASTIGIFITSIKANSDTLKMTRLNQELQAVTTLMSRDLRRAGYWGTPATANAYAAETDTSIANCILLAYDIGSDGAGGADDFVGYLWVDDGLGGSGDGGHIEMRVSTTDFDDCSGLDVDGWTEITDSSVVLISNPPLFTSSSEASASTTVTTVELNVFGVLREDEDVSRRIIETVRLRNDIVN
ncbi:hypothetical protein A9Q78_01900 [Methylophaga sp. 41_12_T18]|nr:hypothetical protein A9Q78_01900 [Methylophaga sp. 41_12_T18]